MKNLIIILSGFLLFTLGSCNKEEISLNQHRDLEYRCTDSEESDDNKSCTGGENVNDPIDPTITDPNRDEDEEIKAKSKRRS